ncbi:hypothetical protein QVD17_21973 [Tagetes erecta]|uniref:Uncharacterized protein n=1 Tax=Tagetes erecta TaxID=13708 RepID=A0AAD8NTB4_TARER|nr:hypothetical protein QVD17_21973 [Tagetes erecta]
MKNLRAATSSLCDSMDSKRAAMAANGAATRSGSLLAVGFIRKKSAGDNSKAGLKLAQPSTNSIVRAADHLQVDLLSGFRWVDLPHWKRISVVPRHSSMSGWTLIGVLTNKSFKHRK